MRDDYLEYMFIDTPIGLFFLVVIILTTVFVASTWKRSIGTFQVDSAAAHGVQISDCSYRRIEGQSDDSIHFYCDMKNMSAKTFKVKMWTVYLLDKNNFVIMELPERWKGEYTTLLPMGETIRWETKIPRPQNFDMDSLASIGIGINEVIPLEQIGGVK